MTATQGDTQRVQIMLSSSRPGAVVRGAPVWEALMMATQVDTQRLQIMLSSSRPGAVVRGAPVLEAQMMATQGDTQRLQSALSSSRPGAAMRGGPVLEALMMATHGFIVLPWVPRAALMMAAYKGFKVPPGVPRAAGTGAREDGIHAMVVVDAVDVAVCCTLKGLEGESVLIPVDDLMLWGTAAGKSGSGMISLFWLMMFTLRRGAGGRGAGRWAPGVDGRGGCCSANVGGGGCCCCPAVVVDRVVVAGDVEEHVEGVVVVADVGVVGDIVEGTSW